MGKNSSVRQEIDLHRGSQSEPEWLVEHGFIPSYRTPYDLVQVSEWERPGSEAYVLKFAVQTGQSTIKAIAKACIKTSPLETVREWHSRRERLLEFDLSVPNLYSVHRADYIEEFI